MPIGKRLKNSKPRPKHYDSREGYALIETSTGGTRIRVLLDSGSNIFLINQNLVKNLHILYETRQTALPILTFEGTNGSYGGKHFTTPILLEIGRNGQQSHIACEIASAGKYDLIIAFGWWQNENPLSHIEDPKKWEFTDTKCQSHVEDEGIADMFKWDQMVAFDEEAQYVGQYVGRVEMRKDQMLGTALPEG